jgi:hypothetical protein
MSWASGELSDRSLGNRPCRRKGVVIRNTVLGAVFAVGIVALSPAAPSANARAMLTWIPGSSVKLEQVIGDRDWADAARGIDGPRSGTTTPSPRAAPPTPPT